MKPSLFSHQTLQFDISPLLETVRKILCCLRLSKFPNTKRMAHIVCFPTLLKLIESKWLNESCHYFMGGKKTFLHNVLFGLTQVLNLNN